MTDFVTLAKAIASQLDGTFRGDMDSGNRAYVDLQHERAGLVVSLSRGYGVEASRVRATIHVNKETQGGLDYRALPAFHSLETAAAMSRGADVIARQIESRIVQPAMPMLESVQGAAANKREQAAKLAGVVERYKELFPTAQISIDPRDDGHAGLSWSNSGSNADYRYIRARLYSDGHIYIDRASGLPESVAIAFLSAFTAK